MFDCWHSFYITEYSKYYITKKATFSGDCKQFRQKFVCDLKNYYLKLIDYNDK